MIDGDPKTFDTTWKTRNETLYNHWTRDTPQNQVQFAFRNHWTLFNELLKSEYYWGGQRCLEVGCGRGTLSAYFSDAGYDCTLLDFSENVIRRARQFFELNHLPGSFHVGDADRLPFAGQSFDIVFSMGLMEHFIEIETAIREQIRVLSKGGILICYVVPEFKNNVQNEFRWINTILNGYVTAVQKPMDKKRVYRNTYGSNKYIKEMEIGSLKGISARGVYPLPMISHSVEFPFTLMPENSEKALVKYFEGLLENRKRTTGEHPWLCDEGYGQGILIWGYKTT